MQLHNMINNLINRKQKSKKTIKVHNANGNGYIANSNDEVSEKFDKYFSNIATNIINANISTSHPFDPGRHTSR